jgi:hypothetical protein
MQILLEDPKGGIRDPQMHYSGKKILFAYRKGGTHPYHLYEINIDGTGLTQLTDGPDDDIEPTYCPDGSIVFCSSRCRRFVNCWHTRVATLYRCDGDGSNIRMLSSNNDHDNTPWVLPDGRVLYMRWEYVDRSQVHYHHLWTTNPDGTQQMVYYGNLHPGIAMLDAKPVPDTDKVIASFSPGHGRPEHLGTVTLVSPKKGPDHLPSAESISKQNWWKDPYAITEDFYLVASNKGLAVMDRQGNYEFFYELPQAQLENDMAVHEPRPLRGRPRERVIAPRVDLSSANGRVVLQDIYQGRNLSGLERGQVKKILVLKQLPKPANFSGGMEPLTIGGSFTMAEVLGTVPVEEDGSAYMELPALQSIFFVALDENDKAVKRMHSFLVLQPGETMSCVGCHEPRTATPHATGSLLEAMSEAPDRPHLAENIPSILDFPRDIQPILDQHCVECHNPDDFAGKVDLCGDKTMRYTMSYWQMRTHDLVVDARNRPESNYAIYRIGSGASRLLDYIDGDHYDVKVSDHQRDLIRLWIDTSATYPGTYAALNTGDHPARLNWGKIAQRCGECHLHDAKDRRGKPIKRWHFGRGISTTRGTTYNISRPEKSLALRAPLAKEAGGLALCEKVVFQNKEDPLYREILSAVQDAHRRLQEGKRFDMPGFRPNEDYIREMQRFGFVPKDLGPEETFDFYAAEKAYFDSWYFDPEKKKVGQPIYE